MTIQKSFSLPETEENLRLMKQLARLSETGGRSQSELIRDAIFEFVEKHTRLVQSQIDSFKNPLEEQLDRLHATFVSPNPKAYESWEACLKGEGLLCPQAIEYSLNKGWKITTATIQTTSTPDRGLLTNN